ncbi:hypothetical protein ACMSE7_02565 [Bacteroides thetaiotaomicron]|uniref:hypothetical protein n=1 Tax=Bacteroides thetaiotaomicron TaxID=818 RepID=UPI0039C4D48A
MKYALYSSGQRRLQSYSVSDKVKHTGTLDSIYNHPRLPKLSEVERRGFILDD